jgi:hypothetical protein
MLINYSIIEINFKGLQTLLVKVWSSRSLIGQQYFASWTINRNSLILKIKQ